MAVTLEQLGLYWDISTAESVEASQQWLLSAMHKHGDELVTMLWRILGNEDDVCDVYQQTFLNIAHRETKRKPKNVRAYLYRTATNIAVAMLKRQQLKISSSVDLTNIPHKTARETQFDLDAMGIQQQLRTAIAKLPKYYREVVVLHDLGELSYRDIAKILGLTVGTIRVYRSRAVILLAKMMAGEKEQVADE